MSTARKKSPAKKASAVKPPQVPHRPGRYEVVGNHSVDGVAPGGLVTVTDPDRARRLYRGRHIAQHPTEEV